MSTVLVIGMADSIHIARWLEQFENSPHIITFIPSRKFRKFNSELENLLSRANNINLSGIYRTGKIAGYIDFLLIEILGNILKRNLRALYLKRFIKKHSFEILHLIEMQSAGYLYLMVADQFDKKTDKILTNWGSDIYYYQNDLDHRKKIQILLREVNFYSAECSRDYLLAQEFGFKGALLPIIPNAGGFRVDSLIYEQASKRKLILVKGTGGEFGNVGMLLPILYDVLNKYADLKVTFYSVTSDMMEDISQLASNFPRRVDYHPIEKKLPHDQMLALFKSARIYLSSSRSDGISTSFLESLVSGAYPIQSNTSCASDWLEKGFMGSSIANESQVYRATLVKAIESNDLVDKAQKINRRLALENLDVETISDIAKSFYDKDFLRSLPTSITGATS